MCDFSTQELIMGAPSTETNVKASKARKEPSLAEELLTAIKKCTASAKASEKASDKSADKGANEAEATAEAKAAETAEGEARDEAEALESARKVRGRFRSDLHALASQYFAMLSIPITVPLRTATPWAVELGNIYSSASKKLAALDGIKVEASPAAWIKPLDECLPSARELTAARSQLSTLEPPLRSRRSRISTWFMRLVPSMAAILVGALGLYGLIWLQKKVVEADLHEHSSLAEAAVREAVIELDSAGSKLDTVDRGKAPPTVADQGELFSRFASAHALANTALDALDRVQQLAHANGTHGSSRLTVQLSQSTGLGNAAAETEKRLSSRVFTDSTAARNSRTNWLWVMREYRDALTKTVESLACASAIAWTLPSDKVFHCFTGAALVNRAKTRWTARSSSLLLADGFRGRTREDFVVKLLFALSFLFMGGGVVILLGRLTGLIDAKTTLERLVEQASAGEVKSAFGLWPLIAPLGLSAGLIGGYLLAEPSIDHERTETGSMHVPPVSRPDTSALARLQRSVDLVRDTVDSISGRAQ
jgi:hypothetical protein